MEPRIGEACREEIPGRGGQALAEYAMILFFVALACVAAVTLLGIPVRGFYVAFNGSF